MNIDAQKLPNNVRLNKDIFALLGFDGLGKDGSLSGHVWGQRFCVWKDSIQDGFDDIASWNAEKIKLAHEFGWTIDRLQKNAMVLEAALEAHCKKSTVAILEKLCIAILAAFEPKKLSA